MKFSHPHSKHSTPEPNIYYLPKPGCLVLWIKVANHSIVRFKGDKLLCMTEMAISTEIHASESQDIAEED
jgi:hypothetical protein